MSKDNPPTDDRSLLARIAQQDQAALAQLYNRYARLVFAIAFKSFGSVEESEEAVLDVFSQVWRTATRYDPAKGRVDTWLLIMARSRILDRLRKQQRIAKGQTAVETEIQFAKSSGDPIEDAQIVERRAIVQAAIKQLSDPQRQVIELAFYQGLSHSEIAAQTGLSLGTVKTRIRLGLGKLRIALGTWELS
ncbi:MAG: sigma-70 family RNA polymerase sigma factor [Leptolyngbyaceae cyanobacterium SM1_3_5]|nr:sigma-70 family RNA polymerase sigma factor [Leptolyngbyaceae cyanobacterium SM1_3_5]